MLKIVLFLGILSFTTLHAQFYTPLMSAALDGDLERVEEAIDEGALIDARDEQDNTALFYAIESGNLEIVKRLLEAHAYLNHVNKEGKTPLLLSLQYRHDAISRYLLAQNPNLLLRDNALLGPREYAIIYGGLEILERIDEAYEGVLLPHQLPSGIDLAKQHHKNQLLHYIVLKDDTNSTLRQDLIPYAIEAKEYDLLQTLLAQGGDLKTESLRQRALYLAMEFRDYALIDRELNALSTLMRDEYNVTLRDQFLHHALIEANTTLLQKMIYKGFPLKDANVPFEDRRDFNHLIDHLDDQTLQGADSGEICAHYLKTEEDVRVHQWCEERFLLHKRGDLLHQVAEDYSHQGHAYKALALYEKAWQHIDADSTIKTDGSYIAQVCELSVTIGNEKAIEKWCYEAGQHYIHLAHEVPLDTDMLDRSIRAQFLARSAWFFLRAKSINQAKLVAKEASNLSPNAAYAFAFLGHALMLTGDKKGAEEAYRSYFYFNKDPKNLDYFKRDLVAIQKRYPKREKMFDFVAKRAIVYKFDAIKRSKNVTNPEK